ncbi:MAG: s-methyl-5-thioribose-1-phosphate isomerase [Oscillospiraceae bacterium]|nr:s-methyl-5-thioribose-1-phosphate isomerase [Oscillospiraceae bacterium]
MRPGDGQRADHDLAFLLRYENVAWYEDGAVRILDRRIYPAEIRFVVCHSHREVAQAITDMVTQSCGPFTAAAAGMALAAWECRTQPEAAQRTYLRQAAYTISHARPTTAARMERITGGCLAAAEEALKSGRVVDRAIMEHLLASNNKRYSKVAQMASYLVDLFPDDGKIMTQCFGETIVGMMLREARSRGKRLRLFCPETRPYFQGARLTATVCREMGFDTTVITDNMPAWVMQTEGIDVFTCAADAICLDGHVVNKIGTLQIAIAARYMGIPFFVSGIPDESHPDKSAVHIESRNPDFVLQAMGVRTAAEGVKGYYPSFDLTPPALISGVVTDLGIYSPYDLPRYLRQADIGPYEMVI